MTGSVGWRQIRSPCCLPVPFLLCPMLCKLNILQDETKMIPGTPNAARNF